MNTMKRIDRDSDPRATDEYNSEKLLSCCSLYHFTVVFNSKYLKLCCTYCGDELTIKGPILKKLALIPNI